MVTEEDVRRAALSLPEVTESAWGLRVKGRLFAAVNHRYGEPALVLWCRDLDEKEAMLEARPELFFTMPHYDGHASVLARLSVLGQAELEALLAEAHRVREATPKRSRGGTRSSASRG